MKSPMLAVNFDEEQLTFPRYASVKLDGWRAVIVDGVVKTRSGKAVRNKHVQGLFGRPELNGLDGELIVGPPNLQTTYNTTETALKREDGEPNVHFWVFDKYDMPGATFESRFAVAESVVNRYRDQGPQMTALVQTVLHNMADLEVFELQALANDYEGVMLRPVGHTGRPEQYKYGRSTLKEALLLKVKRFSHDEAEIIGHEERMINNNESYSDELGRTKRSSHQENLEPSGMIGSYIVKSPKWSIPFKVSCGSMSDDEKKAAWDSREDSIGLTLRFKHFSHGAKDAPRHALYAGFRSPEDMS